ncbi:hypothetical protein [uncultured Sulfitobacter sp.]|uniref:hypothetical protein n=1 Tax=uncultured Sulfitobacter sp. TaxID=191468 RepID=UPI002592E5B8|nr:hypothetical protein [uncultured Sulfitobacter sp.]
MSIHYNEHEKYFVAICDECDEVVPLEAETFDEAVDEVEIDGWQRTHNGDKWCNFCPDCQ